MTTAAVKLSGKNVSPFYFMTLSSGGRLVTNDWGGWAVLREADFLSFVSGALREGHPRYSELAAGGFFLQPDDFIGCSEKFTRLHSSVFEGTGLHIMILTLRCNQKCVYCHASARGAGEKDCDMDEGTARRTVDFILSSPRKELTIEFQGGEPLLNWDVLKFVVAYAGRRAKELKKKVGFKLVTNLSGMDGEKTDFILGNFIGVSTSLDGPAGLHDAQRVLPGGSAHAGAAKWIRRFDAARRRYLKKGYFYRLSGLATVTRNALARPKDLVDSYLACGLREIYARPLNPFGFSAANWRRIGYGAAEYLSFYRRLLEYLISLDAKGVKVREKTAQMFLTKILRGDDPSHMDCRLMCGAAIGQLAYNYNGDIYTCDEGRMLAVGGDQSFRLGNVASSKYRDILESPVTKTLCVASCLEGLPGCSDCAFKPYCGVCPINSYFHGGLFPQKASDDRCAVNKGILELIFEKLTDVKSRAVLESWLRTDWYRDGTRKGQRYGKEQKRR